jgi:hypothetical protein
VSSKTVQNEPFLASVARELGLDEAAMTVVKTPLAVALVVMTIQQRHVQTGNSAWRARLTTRSQKAR